MRELKKKRPPRGSEVPAWRAAEQSARGDERTNPSNARASPPPPSLLLSSVLFFATDSGFCAASHSPRPVLSAHLHKDSRPRLSKLGRLAKKRQRLARWWIAYSANEGVLAAATDCVPGTVTVRFNWTCLFKSVLIYCTILHSLSVILKHIYQRR